MRWFFAVIAVLQWSPASAETGTDGLALGYRVATEPVVLEHISVVDADTIDVGAERIRLSNLDAPEAGGRANCDAERALAERGRAAAAEIFASARYVLAYPQSRRDRHGRVLARINVDGRDYGEMMVEQGLGRPWRGRSSDWCAP